MGKKNLYDQSYFQGCISGPQSLAWVIKTFLRQKNANEVLDVGCGPGWLVRYLNQENFTVLGCDNSDEALQLAKAKNKVGHLVIKASATKLPFPNKSFDAILAISIIEHLSEKEAHLFLKEAYRILRPKGWIFVVTPNKVSLLRFLYSLVGKTWPASKEPTHIFFYTPKSLKNIMKTYSYSNFQFTFTSSLDTPFDFAFPQFVCKLPAFIKHALNYLIISVPPFYYWRTSFWLAARK